MNQVDKELLLSKGFMNEQERVNDVEIQVSALMEATVFAGSILDNNLDLSKLMAVSLYIEELASKKNYLHIHLYVQRCFADSRSGGELNGFYAASLHEEVLEGYALYFALYLRKIVSEINEARKKIREYQRISGVAGSDGPGKTGGICSYQLSDGGKKS